VRLGKGAVRLRELGYRFGSRERRQSKLTAKVMLDYLLMLMELRFKVPVRFARPRWSHESSAGLLIDNALPESAEFGLLGIQFERAIDFLMGIFEIVRG